MVAKEPMLALRERIVRAAATMTMAQGWAAVTMAKLADVVGVSRQTVYNEIGGKPALAEAMVLDELARFLSLVNKAFADHPNDLVKAIEGASRAVLEHADDNTLLHAIVSATHGADTELLPLLTTNSQSLLGVAKAVVAEFVTNQDTGLTPAQLDVAIDMVVRVVLSHVMQPTASPAETAAGIAWMADRVLNPH
ncbi:TetR family transcriptional regulator [Nocardioides sp. Bht2]|uniref:TetR/AcrR family transcriptional regulator n=1 Tax=Nocardioides sp. Bht2 TaxID=3392297 RepID=UPI0039B48AD8